jgi:iron complex outermembrane receptor protein
MKLGKSLAFMMIVGYPLSAGLVHAQSTGTHSATDANSAAQDSGAPADARAGSAVTGLSEIVVTAEKRSEKLSDVPLSITAITGSQLADRGIVSTADLEKLVPGFTYRSSQYGTPIFSIRGIGFYDEQVALEPTVTVYVDQVPLPYARMTEGAALDLERVEVLKGPQGTLFGQNSTGGAVNYIAAKPTDTFAAGANATYARFNEIDAGGFVGGPLTSDLNARLSFRTEHRDGWQKSITRDDSNGARNFSAGRLLLDWTPVDRLHLEVNLNGWSDKSEVLVSQPRGYLPVNTAPQTTTVTIATATALANYPYPTGNDNRLGDWNPGADLHRNDRFYQGAIQAKYAVSDSLRLVSISSYARLDSYAPIDIDATSVNAAFAPIAGHIRSFSEELRLEGEVGDWKWVVGGNYAADETRELQLSTLNGSNSQAGTYHFSGVNISNNDSIGDSAGFGNLDYQITDTVRIQGGVRYTKETRDFNGCLADNGAANGFRVFFPDPIPPGGCVTFLPNGHSGLYRTSLDQSNTSWRSSINWKITPDILLYANATKGFKAGSFSTLPAVSYLQLIPVPQESVLAYEAGFKASVVDHTVDVTGAAFYYDYTDKQLQGYLLVPPFGNLPNLVSIPKSRVEGGELSATVRPISGIQISLSATYVDSRVLGAAMVGNPFGASINASGEAFPATPTWQLQADGEYNFPLSGTWSAFVGMGFSYRTSTVAAFGSKTGSAGTQSDFNIDAYGLLDARAGIDISNRYRVEVFGKNITNKQYWSNVTHIYDTYDRTTGFPVTYGITASAKF